MGAGQRKGVTPAAAYCEAIGDFFRRSLWMKPMKVAARDYVLR
jgi:hypothetical protein